MSESEPVALVSEGTEPPAGSQGHRGLLIFVGVVEILLGLLGYLLTAFMCLGLALLSRLPPDKMPNVSPGLIIQSVMIVFAGATWFLVFGIGTIKGRRWARAIMLVTSWVWFLFGLWGIFIFNFMQSRQVTYGTPPPTEIAKTTGPMISAITEVFLWLFYVILPFAFIVFYQRKSVRETFERLDPKPRWTDACPLPVLAMSLMLWGLTLGTLLYLRYGFYPMFGRVLTGVTGFGVIVGHGLVYAWLAWATYRCRIAGWWGVLVFVVLIPGASLLVFGSPDAGELMKRMQVPLDPQVRSFIPMIQSKGPLLWIALAIVEVGYLLYVKQFFKPAGAATMG
ncbi:MAG TPA: hypothetical protein VFB49_09565 [Patescibacteria group bacterium]|nr:hypothetical protein [Patescibacteria group bacterium]